MQDPTTEPKRDGRLELDSSLSGLDAKPQADDAAASKDPRQKSSGYGYGYGNTAGADELHLLDYVRVVHKRRWTALTAFLLVFGSVTVYTFTVTPVYNARVQILIENENPNVVKFEEVYDQNKATIDYYQTQYRILQSRALARRTLDAEKLWDHPLINGSQSRLPSLNPIRWFAKPVPPVSADSVNETTQQSRVIDAFLGVLPSRRCATAAWST